MTRTRTLPIPLFTALFASLLTGCDSGLTVDVSGGTHPQFDSIVVDISAIEFVSEDIELSTLDSTVDAADLADYADGGMYQLVGDGELPAADYVGFRLQIDASNSYARGIDGGEYALDLVTSGDFWDADFTVEDNGDFEDGDTLHLLVVIDPIFSLSTDDSDADSRLFQPVARLVDPDEVGQISGRITAALAEGSDCSASTNDTEELAVYLFEGSDQTPEDYVSGHDGPIAAAPVTWSDGHYEFILRFLPPGNYSLALTCTLSAENPFANDGDSLRFSGTSNATVTDDATTDVTISG